MRLDRESSGSETTWDGGNCALVIDYIGRRCGPQTSQYIRGRVAAQQRNQRRLQAFEGCQRQDLPVKKGAALHARGPEQPLRQRRGQQHLNVERTCRLPEDHHMRGIAAEGGDVLLDPSERRNLVHYSIVARGTGAFGCQQWVHKETQHS